MQDAATATDVGPDELAALKHVALADGLTETKVSCAALGDRLDASTQTASRRLQRLEAADLIEREVVGDGQWVRVTEAGEAALRSEYADYRRIFETETALTLSGVVTSGMGEGRHYITLDGYMRQFRERLGYEPFPGTLNVDLDEASVRRRAELGGIDAVPVDAWEGDDRTYGAATCFAATVVAGGATDGDGTDEEGGRSYEGAHVIVPDRTHHDESQIEVIAPDRLRDELDLDDREPVDVRIEPTSRADEEGA
ncbi:DUF120 domain-containing protein [Haloparvum alkalitolerans]|uniref:DUF120 domain-containing protein n=1 Tax=Haloparvum alkalitolerans TaxID=1042953 RepID=UPI003CEBD127